MTRTKLRFRWFAASIMLLPTLASAQVTQFVIQSRQIYNDGTRYGHAGKYEQLNGYAVGELDPANPLNAGIVNLDKAPRNAQGRVEYRVDVRILKPVDLSKGNGTMLYDVVNRGRPLILGRGAGPEDGYTFVWSGWQGDIPMGGSVLGTSFPIATDNGQPIIGPSREEYVDIGTTTYTAALSYPAATMDRSQASLTVREKERDPRMPIDTWHYIDDRHIQIDYPGGGFDAGAIYEFIYPAKDPTVMGIGFAATRDVNSFLRFGSVDAAGNPNPLAVNGQPAVARAIIEGISQSGRFTRDYLWQGFNQDEQGRKIFDGAMPIIPGSRKTFTNFQFAKPGWWSKQHEQHLQPGDQFPFTYPTITDPVTGKTDGILAKCTATGTCPKLMHVDGEFEVWGARGSLLVSNGDPSGPQPVVMPANVRLYMVAGTPHGGAGTTVPTNMNTGICKYVNSSLSTYTGVHALLPALNAWVTSGKLPPASRYPSVTDGTLVLPDQVQFPAIPGVEYTGIYNYLHDTNYSVEPPAEGAQYRVLVPQVNADGIALGGIHVPQLQVPIATYTGWNLRAPGHAENEGCSSSGSFLPFAATKAQRLSSGDPRLSIEERYPTHGAYVSQIRHAAQHLVADGLLTRTDAQAITEEAANGTIGK